MDFKMSITADEARAISMNVDTNGVRKAVEEIERLIQKNASTGSRNIEFTFNSSVIREEMIPTVAKIVHNAGFYVSYKHWSTYAHTKMCISW